MNLVNKEMIAKDKLITKVLKGIKEKNFGANIILKGGTSLTKAYGYSDRMSEDLDLVLLTKSESIQNSLRRYLSEKFGFKQKGNGHQRTVLSGKLISNSISIKIDIKIDIIEHIFVEKQIFEFNSKGNLVKVEGLTFLVGDLEETFLQKIFAFQNKAYSRLVRNKIGRAKKFSSIPDISTNERSLSSLPKGEVIRLARHFYDITKIWKDIKLTKSKIDEMISLEKANTRVMKSPYLKYVYENFGIDKFLIFNTDKETITRWLNEIKNNFTYEIDPKNIIKEIEIIKNSLKLCK